MSRPAMIAMVCLAAYSLLDLAVSTLVALVWRTRAVAPSHLPPAVRARRVLQLRLTPVVASLSITALIVAPAFVLFEPAQHDEEFGPLVAIIATLGLAHLAGALMLGARSLWLTNRVAREWLRAASPLESGS